MAARRHVEVHGREGRRCYEGEEYEADWILRKKEAFRMSVEIFDREKVIP